MILTKDNGPLSLAGRVVRPMTYGQAVSFLLFVLVNTHEACMSLTSWIMSLPVSIRPPSVGRLVDTHVSKQVAFGQARGNKLKRRALLSDQSSQITPQMVTMYIH